MWVVRPKSSARRKEIRRTRAERNVPWYRRAPGVRLWFVSLTLATAIACAVILNLGGPVLEYRPGQTVQRAITSRIDFQLEDDQATAAARLRARDTSPNYYRADQQLLDDIKARFMTALTLARNNANEGDKLRSAAADVGVKLDDAGVAELTRLAALSESNEYERAVDAAIRLLAVKPLVEPLPESSRRTATTAMLSMGTNQVEMSVGKLLFANNPEAIDEVATAASNVFDARLAPSVKNSIVAMLSATDKSPAKAIYRYDSARTIEESRRAQDSVQTQYNPYPHGAILADAGVITPEEYTLLRAENEKYRERLAAEDGWSLSAWLPAAGRSLLAVLVVFGLAGFLVTYQRAAARRVGRHATVSAVIVLMLALTRAIYSSTDLPPHFALGVLGLSAALLGIIYANATVFAACGAVAILLVIATHQGISFLVTMLGVSGMLVYGLRDVRNRGKIVGVAFVAAIAAALISLGNGIFSGQTREFSLWLAAWAGGTTLMAGFIMEGVLPFAERFFRFSTSMTLLEWCDANKPLLRQMAADAPGTYNHSMMVGTLAEAAADAIGVNGLLCRAGAYYHDIGKINKPDYFVENQVAGASRHERLSPAMSLLIIIGHVKDGIEMAKEYGLPSALRPFIAEHHGTTLVEYFYHAANRQRKEGDPEVADTEFRYPGPKPQSRETAILMLCDAVEGAVRAMPEPTPGRIEQVVGDIVQKRLMDGQFDECDLTFRELATIEKSLIKSLCGIYHARIVYPDADEERRAPERQVS